MIHKFLLSEAQVADSLSDLLSRYRIHHKIAARKPPSLDGGGIAVRLHNVIDS